MNTTPCCPSLLYSTHLKCTGDIASCPLQCLPLSPRATCWQTFPCTFTHVYHAWLVHRPMRQLGGRVSRWVLALRGNAGDPGIWLAGDEESGYQLSQRFVDDMMTEFREERKIHRRFAFEIIVQARSQLLLFAEARGNSRACGFHSPLNLKGSMATNCPSVSH